eukprot:TRINITY_DN7039_c0_g1_i3.p1 TRINITY_DN7039_c0_g1~~TRINITY_DN7039_c0_g1_i3.p1  ORF type:complete len:179 (+),score=9.28 TRINITY_DN7039_c0_g1_i3:76-612(+)
MSSCYSCHRPILGESIHALGHTYHPEHFLCHHCSDPLGTADFHDRDGSPHCRRCYDDVYRSRCARCDQVVDGEFLSALGKKWHHHHFICTTCSKPFHGGKYFEREGKPYCDAHYHEEFTPRCAGCNQNIRNGEIVNALGSTWHADHFVCHTCHSPFTGSSFYEIGGRPYCEVHYNNTR